MWGLDISIWKKESSIFNVWEHIHSSRTKDNTTYHFIQCREHSLVNIKVEYCFTTNLN